MSFNQANAQFTNQFSSQAMTMKTEETTPVQQTAQNHELSAQTFSALTLNKIISQIASTDASSSKTSSHTSQNGSTGPVKKKWSRFVEATSISSCEEVSEQSSDEECLPADFKLNMRRMRMRGSRRSEEEEEVMLKKRADVCCDKAEGGKQFERCFFDSQPSKVPPQAPRPYYLPPHHGGHSPHPLHGGYACGLVNLSSTPLHGQTGQQPIRDLQDRDRLRDPLRGSLLINQLEREQSGYENPQQLQQPQHPQLQQQEKEHEEEERLTRETEGSALFSVTFGPQGNSLSNRNCNPPNNNRNCGQNGTTHSTIFENQFIQVNSEQNESCFSCDQAAATAAAGSGELSGGLGLGSQSLGSCCCCSSVSSCTRTCFFKRTTERTTKTLTTTTTTTGTEDVVVDSPATSVQGADAQDLAGKGQTADETNQKVEEPKEYSENKCSSSCKQIISDVSSLDDIASRYAMKHSGRYIQLKVRFHDKFSFKCTLDHKIQLSSEEMKQDKWCAKCDELFKIAQRHAKKKDGVVLDEKISPMVNFKCSRGHNFQLKPAEKLSKWCSTCSSSTNLNFSKSVDDGISWHFIGATHRNSNDSLFTNFQTAFEKQTSSQDLLEVLNNLEYAATYAEIKKLAVTYLHKFVKEAFQGSASEQYLRENMEQFIWVYRVILMPEAILKHLLYQFGEKQARNNYRRLCILTHPDKNCHPLAGKAFQKLLCAFTMN